MEKYTISGCLVEIRGVRGKRKTDRSPFGSIDAEVSLDFHRVLIHKGKVNPSLSSLGWGDVEITVHESPNMSINQAENLIKILRVAIKVAKKLDKQKPQWQPF